MSKKSSNWNISRFSKSPISNNFSKTTKITLNRSSMEDVLKISLFLGPNQSRIIIRNCRQWIPLFINSSQHLPVQLLHDPRCSLSIDQSSLVIWLKSQSSCVIFICPDNVFLRVLQKFPIMIQYVRVLRGQGNRMLEKFDCFCLFPR